MNSSQISQQELKSHHKEDSKIKKNFHVNHLYPLNGYNYLDYSCLFEFDLLRLMGVEMPPIRQSGYHPNRNGYWRDRHLNMMPPPPMALPFLSQPQHGFWGTNEKGVLE